MLQNTTQLDEVSPPWCLRLISELNAADDRATAPILSDLRIPRNNRLEKLSGNKVGQHSIRINDQYRICFVWGEQGAEDVEITDYHS